MFPLQVHIPLDATTKQHKGLAYVTFAQPSNALAAYEALDKKSFQGRLLHILAAVDRKGKSEHADSDGRKKSLKEEKNLKRKKMAGQEFNWSMLYMNVCRSWIPREAELTISCLERCCGLVNRRQNEHR